MIILVFMGLYNYNSIYKNVCILNSHLHWIAIKISLVKIKLRKTASKFGVTMPENVLMADSMDIMKELIPKGKGWFKKKPNACFTL